jgi:hypothetical protein
MAVPFGQLRAMDAATELTQRVRDHYVAQFQAFIEKQERADQTGVAEVKIQLQGGSPFRHLVCVDFLAGAAKQVVEFQPDKYLRFDAFSGSYGSARLSMEQLRWNDVLISHDLPAPPESAMAVWFQRWFDPDDERHNEDAALGNVIHSLVIEPGLVRVDFGTAPVEAFWQLLDLLEEAGARKLRVHCSEGEA